MKDSQADLDWLYGREPDDTRVFTPEEQARLNQRCPAPQPGFPQQPYPRDYQHGDIQAGRGQAAYGQPPYSRPGHGQSPQHPAGGAQRNQYGPKRRHRLRKFVVTACVLWVAFLVGTPLYAWVTSSTIDASPVGVRRPADQPGTTVLLVGSDGRDSLTAEEKQRLGTGSIDGHRADTMMLLHRPPSGRPVLLSLPRDSYVEIPGHGKNRLNAAFALGGPKLLTHTIEHNTGIRIDGYLEIGFLGVVKAVDAVGGIEICPKKAIKDRDSHLTLNAGCQNINGVTTLGYVRMRKADQRGDLGRVERQREVVGKVAKKAISPWTFVNPVRYWQINMAAKKSVAHGKDTSVLDLFGAASTIFGSTNGKTLSLTVPVSGTPMIHGMSVVTWNQQASQEIFHAITIGDTAPLAKYEK